MLDVKRATTADMYPHCTAHGLHPRDIVRLCSIENLLYELILKLPLLGQALLQSNERGFLQRADIEVSILDDRVTDEKTQQQITASRDCL